ncbi:hypothetical protein CKO51_08170 [Rhodopirellula sp. SM50]|nr:hypothetical protein CKO51_08170 [Rhodopirellula sp. SM50]
MVVFQLGGKTGVPGAYSGPQGGSWEGEAGKKARAEVPGPAGIGTLGANCLAGRANSRHLLASTGDPGNLGKTRHFTEPSRQRNSLHGSETGSRFASFGPANFN